METLLLILQHIPVKIAIRQLQIAILVQIQQIVINFFLINK